MTSFLSGPADGRTLFLKRSPLFLRVVADMDGNVDALDQIDDQPEPHESIDVYRLEGDVGFCHISRRGGTGGAFTVATYRHLAKQPKDTDIRETLNWQSWCQEQPA